MNTYSRFRRSTIFWATQCPLHRALYYMRRRERLTLYPCILRILVAASAACLAGGWTGRLQTCPGRAHRVSRWILGNFTVAKQPSERVASRGPEERLVRHWSEAHGPHQAPGRVPASPPPAGKVASPVPERQQGQHPAAPPPRPRMKATPTPWTRTAKRTGRPSLAFAHMGVAGGEGALAAKSIYSSPSSSISSVGSNASPTVAAPLAAFLRLRVPPLPLARLITILRSFPIAVSSRRNLQNGNPTHPGSARCPHTPRSAATRGTGRTRPHALTRARG
ncbi:hypothetical protein DFJ74DRAFT_667010 [Hyaloraphidium curvatum]|nr:hypothetical protein DFJ74DRAFT_667010 [Hyaloraphidium curvatum]